MKKNLILHSCLAVLAGIIFLIPFVYGWATNFYVKQLVVDAGVVGGYFASGNGSEERPFEITNKRHLYNLAWLQYMGNFNHADADKTDEYKTYYFSLSNDLDCEGLVLPPIGTGDNPFVSVFNGNGHTISNLKVSNDFNQLEQHPNNVDITNYQNVNIIGFFGIIGKYTGTENEGLKIPTITGESGTNVVTSAHHFYLDNLEIHSNKTNSLTGLFAGYVNGNVSNIGVHYSWFNLATGVSPIENSKISNYTLIGDYNGSGEGGIEWGDKPQGGSIGYGTSTDIKELKDKMQALNGTSGTPAIKANQYLPFSGTGEIIKNASGANIGEVADNNNIGYYTGNDIKVYEFKKSNMDTTCFYHPTAASKQIVTLPHTNYEGIVDYPDAEQEIKDATINNPEETIYAIRLQNQIDINNNLVTIENAKLWGEEIPKLVIPRRVIWVAPKRAGTLKFVMINPGNGKNFTLSRFYRTVKGDYSSQMMGLESLIETNNYAGLTTGEKGVTIQVDGADRTFDKDTGLVYYFTYEVTEEMIEMGYEFALSRNNGTEGAYFWYLDVGANGGNVDPTYVGSIEGVDFVYQIDGAFNSFEDKSNVCFEVDSKTGVATDVLIYFKRNQLTGVLYYPTADSVTIVSIGSGSKGKAKDENCDVIA